MNNEFDLQRAIAGDPIETTGGIPAEFIAYRSTLKESKQVIVQALDQILTYDVNGRYYRSAEHPNDLRMKHVLRKIDWSNIPEDTIISTPEGDRHIAKCPEKSTLVLTYPEGKSSFTCGLRELEEHPKAKCYLVEQQPWTIWHGGNCPIPDGLEFEYMIHDKPGQIMINKKREGTYLWGIKYIYTYRLTGKVLDGWTL
jgi:hypothetical protein